MNQYQLGDLVEVEIESYDLVVNDYYYLEWDLNNGSQVGNFSWYAYSTFSLEIFNLSGLPLGSHCISATLYNNTSSSALDFDYTCFSVTNQSTTYPPGVWIGTDMNQYQLGDLVEVEIESYDLVVNDYYYLEWDLNNGSQVGNFSWYAYSTFSLEIFNLSGLPLGSHCISATLYNNTSSSALDFDYTCFSVTNQSTTYPPGVWIGTDMNQYQLGDLVEVEIESYDLVVNDYYYLEWDLNNGSQVGNFSWYAYSTF